MISSKIELLENEYDKLFSEHEEINLKMYEIKQLLNAEIKINEKLEKKLKKNIFKKNI